MNLNKGRAMQRTIIVTGAGSGIGKATAKEFLENGYKVGFLGRRATTLETAANGHKNALILPCDVSDPVDVETAFATAMASWGRLDVLFNNAGIGSPPASVDETDVDVWLKVVAINLTGSFLCARAAFSQMRRHLRKSGAGA